MGFFEGLENNIRSASESALIKSVVADPDETVGGIIAALEEQEEGKFLLDAFKGLTIGQIVHAAMENIRTAMDAEGTVEPEPVPEPEIEMTAPKASPKRPKAPLRKGSNGASAKPTRLDLSTPEQLKAYENAILKALKQGNHVDGESGISSQNLRKIVGGEADQARAVLDTLILHGRCMYYGKARGTKYYLFA